MNIIGALGAFIIKYQKQIEIAVIILAILLVIAIIVKIVKDSKKKETILSEINNTVTEINTTVNRLNEKKTEVIYIDNHLPKCNHRMDTNTESEDDKHSNQDVEVVETEVMDISGEEKQNDESDEQVDIPIKFSSRDSSVSKKGHVYTVEELIKQIQE